MSLTILSHFEVPECAVVGTGDFVKNGKPVAENGLLLDPGCSGRQLQNGLAIMLSRWSKAHPEQVPALSLSQNW